MPPTILSWNTTKHKVKLKSLQLMFMVLVLCEFIIFYLFICSSQSSGGGGLSATVRANRTCRSHSFITPRALWLSYKGTGEGVTVSTSIRESESLQNRKHGIDVKHKNSWAKKSICPTQLIKKKKSYFIKHSNSQWWLRLATGGNKKRPCGACAAGIWVSIPRFGIAVV